MRKNIIRVMYILSILLLITFNVKSIVDYVKYTEANSAPFYVFILVNAIVYIFPAIVCYVIAKIISKKVDKNKE